MNVLDLGGAYKRATDMDLSPSNEQLECEFQVCSQMIEHAMLQWQKFNQILTLTAMEIENICAWPPRTGHFIYEYENRDYKLQLGIARICYLRLQELTRKIKYFRRIRPRFISYDEETFKHVWDREYLYET